MMNPGPTSTHQPIYVPVGEYAGYSIAEVLLADPIYFDGMSAASKLSAILPMMRNEADRLLAHFDAKPICAPCLKCGGQSTRFLLRDSTVEPCCSQCNPFDRDSKQQIVRTWGHAFACVQRTYAPEGWSPVCHYIFAMMIDMKGMAEDVSQANIHEFFGLVQ